MTLRCVLWANLGYYLFIVFVALCLGGKIRMLRPHHKDTKAQRKILCGKSPTQLSEEPVLFYPAMRSRHISIEFEYSVAISHHLHLRYPEKIPIPAGGQISGYCQGHSADE